MSMRCAKKRGGNVRKWRHQSNTCFQFEQKNSKNVNLVTGQEKTKRPGKCFVLLPLQSTKGHMHTIRTIEIGCRKQRVICACTHWQDWRECVFTNEQAGYQQTWKEFLSQCPCNVITWDTGTCTANDHTSQSWHADFTMWSVHQSEADHIFKTKIQRFDWSKIKNSLWEFFRHKWQSFSKTLPAQLRTRWAHKMISSGSQLNLLCVSSIENVWVCSFVYVRTNDCFLRLLCN